MSRGQQWLAGQLGITQGRVSQLVKDKRLPRKSEYSVADVKSAKAMLRAARAAANATATSASDSADAELSASDAAIREISKNPERVARIKLLVERTAKIKLERELLAGGYIRKEDVEKDATARVYSVRAKMQEIPLRAALIAHKSEQEAERILTDWMREICDFYANGGN